MRCCRIHIVAQYIFFDCVKQYIANIFLRTIDRIYCMQSKILLVISIFVLKFSQSFALRNRLSCFKMSSREVIATPLAPAAIGPYSQAIKVSDELQICVYNYFNIIIQ